MLTLAEIDKAIQEKGMSLQSGKRLSINEAKPGSKATLRKALWENEEILSHRRKFEKKFRVDYADAKSFNVESFDWNKVAAKCGTTIHQAFTEADSSSSFVQVLRAGVQAAVNQMYETVDTSFESWVHTIQSKRSTELYAPLHGIGFMREVGAQEKYPEVTAAGLDIKLKNKKYGEMFAVEKELLEDDQTGQFAKQAGLMGEYAKLALEVIIMAKLASVSGAAYSNLSVPTTETKPTEESTYPWSTSLVGGGANRPASFGLLQQSKIQDGFIALMNQKNKLGLKMTVRPGRLLIGPAWRFDAAVLLNSAYYPSVPGAAGSTGTSFAINPIEGIAALTVSRFMFKNDGTVAGDSKAWYLIDDNVPWFVCQIRQGAEVVQEAANSGDSFERDVIRFKVSLRANADHIDPRFAWQGNDGSVVS